MIIERASVEDAKKILDLQKLAYVSEAEIYNDYSIPPLMQSLDQIQTDFANQLFLKASVDGKVVGSVRCYMKQETCYIGRAHGPSRFSEPRHWYPTDERNRGML